MKRTFRLLMPPKKGIAHRVSETIEAAGGAVELVRVEREMRGMTLTRIVVACDASVADAVSESLQRFAGVTVVSVDDGAENTPGRT